MVVHLKIFYRFILLTERIVNANRTKTNFFTEKKINNGSDSRWKTSEKRIEEESCCNKTVVFFNLWKYPKRGWLAIQMCDNIPVCVRWWICNKNTLEKLRLQRLQLCGRSPLKHFTVKLPMTYNSIMYTYVCVRICTFKLELSTNRRSQMLQT